MVVSRVDFLHNIPKITTEKYLYITCVSLFTTASQLFVRIQVRNRAKHIKEEVGTQNSNREQVSGYKKINFVTLERLFGIYKILVHIYSIHPKRYRRSPKRNKNHNIIHFEILLCTFLVFSKMLLVMLWSWNKKQKAIGTFVRKLCLWKTPQDICTKIRDFSTQTCWTSATSERKNVEKTCGC